MKRAKRHKIKHEKPETSSAFNSAQEGHDLAYYIHDRVELMHQVFTVLKSKDLRAMAPECVRRLSIDDLQELCTEELLGISSKRLLAILDGAEPPSDTESSSQSSQEPMETISLDSISSDEEILSQASKKKKHKHRQRNSKGKKHKKKDSEETIEIQEDTEHSKASRAGLTVLELLELQARARAIRAQLHQEQVLKQTQETVVESARISSDSEVEIKEEVAEVLEISSGDEKPTSSSLETALATATAAATEPTKEPDSSNKTSNTGTSDDKESTNNTTEPEKEEDTTKTKKKKDKSKKKDKRDKAPETDTSSRQDTTVDEATKIDIVDTTKVTKRVNDLIITVPQTSTRKIKLNRNKMTVSIPNNAEKDNVVVIDNAKSSKEAVEVTGNMKSVVSRPQTTDNAAKIAEPTVKSTVTVTNKDKVKKDKSKKKKKKEKRQSIDEDHDEITLQLSDSEKMDLLEDFDRKNYDKVSSSSSDSESSSDGSEKEKNTEEYSTENTVDKAANPILIEDTQSGDEIKPDNEEKDVGGNMVEDKTKDSNNSTEVTHNDTKTTEDVTEKPNSPEKCREKPSDNIECVSTENVTEKVIEFTEINDTLIQNNPDIVESESQDAVDSYIEMNKNHEVIKSAPPETEEKGDGDKNIDINEENNKKDVDSRVEMNKNREAIASGPPKKEDKGDGDKNIDINEENNKENEETKEKTVVKQVEASKTEDNAKDMSEGELSSNESSEVEAFELKPEVVCISDEETPKKKKKKDKKSKKEKNKSNFLKSADENFFADKLVTVEELKDKKDVIILEVNDDLIEILELSDDSSCYEVEGTTLSKEPTAEEIAALSAKIDEIEREEVVTEQEILQQEVTEREQQQIDIAIDEIQASENTNVENISWKDRYLGSKKVKKVLTTSNILNALRKKNRQLKKKIEESKKKEEDNQVQEEKVEEIPKEVTVEEGSIEHYNALQGSTKYVDPVLDPKEIEAKKQEIQRKIEEHVRKEIEMEITGEMKKDAKQLLKMYKKLLKYNDIKKQKGPTKQKDPNKKKNKKKKKKEKEGAAGVSNVV